MTDADDIIDAVCGLPPEEIVEALNTVVRVVDDELDTIGIEDKHRVTEVLCNAADAIEVAGDVLEVADDIMDVADDILVLQHLGWDDDFLEVKNELDTAHNIQIKLRGCCNIM